MTNDKCQMTNKFQISNYKNIVYDSKKVESGSVFVAIPGIKTDGYKYIDQAIKNGAKLVVAEKDFEAPDGIEKRIVPDSRKALAELSAEFYGHPSKKLTLIGITGTNGKTTTAYLIESILKTAGFNVKKLGTIDTPTGLTTPEAPELNKFFFDCLKEGVTHVVMEVSSHALAQERVYGLDFDIAIFTNLTHDHLDFHKTMDEYLAAKQKLFAELKNDGFAIINSDDPYSQKIIDVCNAEVMTYGVREIKHEMRYEKDQIPSEFKTPLSGEYNLYNILAAYHCGLALGLDKKIIKKGIESLKGVPGRLERIGNVIVDFAHTPDALEKLLKLVKTFTNGRVILVFGCPGDRDKEKRPIMGKIAAQLADYVILTTDDPHTERPEQIISEIRLGMSNDKLQMSNVEAIVDRKKAIEKALSLVKKDDIVVIAGRGHEQYQDFNGKKVELDDRVVVRELLSIKR